MSSTRCEVTAIPKTHAKQVEGELGVATSIQGSMLPKIFPDFPGRKEFPFPLRWPRRKKSGGDFYDFFFTDYDHFVFLVADVSGKGVPAALFMVIAKTLIKNNVQSGLPLAEAISKTNQQLLEGDDQQMFVTAWVGCLQISTGELTYVNCGHNPPLFSKMGQPFNYLKNISGFVLAGSRKSKYKPYTFMMGRAIGFFIHRWHHRSDEFESRAIWGETASGFSEFRPDHQYSLPSLLIRSKPMSRNLPPGPSIGRHDDARPPVRRLLSP
jgi:hypothetical protein